MTEDKWVEREIRYAKALWSKYISGHLLTKKEKEYLALTQPNYGCVDYGKRWWICDVCGAVNNDSSDHCSRKITDDSPFRCIGSRNEEEKLFKYKPAEQMKMKLK